MRAVISYRREDAAGHAGRVHDRLRDDHRPTSPRPCPSRRLDRGTRPAANLGASSPSADAPAAGPQGAPNTAHVTQVGKLAD
jgi:hypothetical protein